MSSRNGSKDLGDTPNRPSAFSQGSKSMEENKKAAGDKTSLTSVKWHSAPPPQPEREDDRTSGVSGGRTVSTYKTTATIEVTAGGGSGSSGWKPLQRQKVVMAASTLEEDDDGPVADTDNAERTLRKRPVQTVRRGFSCQEPCVIGRRPVTAAAAATTTSSAGGAENRRRWLSADTGGGQTAVNSRSMECLPSPHHRTSFIMAADDRKSLDSGLDDVAAAAAAEMADRRRGLFASGRASAPSHLSLALPSTERRLTILSPHTHTPSTPAGLCPAAESSWHFSATSSMSGSSHATVYAARNNRKKNRPGMILPRLVLPGSSDLDIFSQ